MPPTAVKFHPAAAEEAAAAYEWYAQRSLIAARGFREELRHAVEAVAKAPDRCHDTALVLSVTFSPGFPSVVYRLRDGEVEVLAVAHGKRRPGYWQHRMQRAP